MHAHVGPGALGPAPSPSRAATIGGLGLLGLSVIALPGYTAVENLVVTGDAAATAHDVAAHATLLRLSAYGLTLAPVLDVVVAWALYLFLRPVAPGAALLTAWLRVAAAAAFAPAVGNLFVAARLVSDPLAGDANPAQLGAQLMTSINAFYDGGNIAVMLSGAHLLMLSSLVLRSRYVPSALGVLIGVSGLGLLVDSSGQLVVPGYPLDLGPVAFVGELVLIVWLLSRGRRLPVDLTDERTSPVPDREVSGR
jgi:hypothetical protein